MLYCCSLLSSVIFKTLLRTTLRMNIRDQINAWLWFRGVGMRLRLVCCKYFEESLRFIRWRLISIFHYKIIIVRASGKEQVASLILPAGINASQHVVSILKDKLDFQHSDDCLIMSLGCKSHVVRRNLCSLWPAHFALPRPRSLCRKVAKTMSGLVMWHAQWDNMRWLSLSWMCFDMHIGTKLWGRRWFKVENSKPRSYT